MQSNPNQPIERCVYPESEFGGFTRFDGTVQFYARIQAILPAEAEVLDIGCGRGAASNDPCTYRRNLRNFRGTGRHVIGIDVDPAGQDNPALDEFRLIPSSRRWPVNDEAFDLALCDYVVEHIEQPEEFFQQWRRVLKPGGYACLRTPNARSYISLISRMTPNRFHAKLTNYAQDGRRSEDVFPTYYRCNTRPKLNRLFKSHGFSPCVFHWEAEPSYLRFSRLAYRFGAVIHRHIPQTFQSTLVAFARKLP